MEHKKIYGAYNITELKAESKADIKDMATKANIAGVKAEIAEVKAEVKAEIAEVKAEVKAEIAELRAEMYQMNNRMIMWMIGIGIAIIGVIKYL